MYLFSLCDGIGCVQYAVTTLQQMPVKLFVAEIERHASQAAQHHHPEARQLGDMRAITPDIARECLQTPKKAAHASSSEGHLAKTTHHQRTTQARPTRQKVHAWKPTGREPAHQATTPSSDKPQALRTLKTTGQTGTEGPTSGKRRKQGPVGRWPAPQATQTTGVTTNNKTTTEIMQKPERRPASHY